MSFQKTSECLYLISCEILLCTVKPNFTFLRGPPENGVKTGKFWTGLYKKCVKSGQWKMFECKSRFTVNESVNDDICYPH